MADDNDSTQTGDTSRFDANGNVEKVLHTGQNSEQADTKFSKRYKYSKTLVLCLVFTCVGMCSKITGSALLDLMERVDTNYEGISQAIALLHPCRAIGSFVVGFILARFRRYNDIILSVVILVYSGSVFATPWARTLDTLRAAYIMQGFATGGCISTCTYMMLQLWTTRASPFLNALYGFASGGLFLAPLIASPFLRSTTNRWQHNDTKYANYSLTVSPESVAKDDTEWKPSRIEVPYAIISGIFASMFIFFVVFQFKKSKSQSEGVRDDKTVPLRTMLNPGSCAEGSCVFGSFMCLCAVFFNLFIRSVDETMISYLLTFAVESELRFPKEEAVLLDSMQGLAQTASRVVMTILSVCVPIQITFLPSLVFTTVFVGCICYIGTASKVHLWGLVLAWAFSFGPGIPAGLAFMNRYMEVSGVLCALIDISTAMGAFAAQLILGILLQYYGPDYVLYFAFVSMATATFFAVLMYCAGCVRGDRHDRAKRRMRKGEVNELVREIVVKETET